VPNWIYIFFNFLYNLGLALWIGGAVALGALTAPELFRALPRQQAGSIFGSILGRFAKLRGWALLMIVIGAGAKFLWWERHAVSPWIAVRWAAIVLMAWALIVDISLQKKMRIAATTLGPDVPKDSPIRALFNLWHARAEGVMKASVIAAVFALIFS
jgi:putative copper export protein